MFRMLKAPHPCGKGVSSMLHKCTHEVEYIGVHAVVMHCTAVHDIKDFRHATRQDLKLDWHTSLYAAAIFNLHLSGAFLTT